MGGLFGDCERSEDEDGFPGECVDDSRPFELNERFPESAFSPHTCPAAPQRPSDDVALIVEKRGMEFERARIWYAGRDVHDLFLSDEFIVIHSFIFQFISHSSDHRPESDGEFRRDDQTPGDVLPCDFFLVHCVPLPEFGHNGSFECVRP